ncbi:MAG TPA: chorismate mutase [Candidatus Limnocylindrales bacterium]
MTDDLDAVRAEIDALDREIVDLLNRRARLGLKAARAKVESGRPLVDLERERDVLLRVAMANNGPVPQEALLALYRKLIETTTSMEEAETSKPKPA